MTPYNRWYNKEDIIMIDLIKFITTIMGLVFPAFLIKAIKAKDDETISKYTFLSCISFGVIVLTLMALN